MAVSTSMLVYYFIQTSGRSLSFGNISLRVTLFFFFFFSSRRRHTRLQGDWSSDVCSSDLNHWECRAKRIRRSVRRITHDIPNDLVSFDDTQRQVIRDYSTNTPGHVPLL